MAPLLQLFCISAAITFTESMAETLVILLTGEEETEEEEED